MQGFEPGSSLIVGASRHVLGELLIERVIAEGRPTIMLMRNEPGGHGRELARRFERAGTPLRILSGDPSAIDLGLSGEEYLALGRCIREVHHLLSPPSGEALEDDPAGAVRELLDLGEHARELERMTFWSSVAASGRRSGVLREEPLSRAPDATEPSLRRLRKADLYASEALDRLPITLLRTGTLVLSPRPPAEDALGAARLLVLFLLTQDARPLRFMPGRADGTISFVPAPHAVDAGLAIARAARGCHGIFHIVDPDPPTVRRAINILCDLTGREAPRLFLPPRPASALLRAPGLSPQVEQLRALLEELGSSLAVSDENARALLEPVGVLCPAFESYAEQLVDEVREQLSDSRCSAYGLERRL